MNLRVSEAVDDNDDDGWGKTAGGSDLLVLIRVVISADDIFMIIHKFYLATSGPPTILMCTSYSATNSFYELLQSWCHTNWYASYSPYSYN